MEKQIGIVGWSVGENSFGAGKAYLEFFSNFGEVHILGPSESVLEWPDLIVLPGGLDTPSSRYKQKPSFFNSNSDLFKEYFLFTVIVLPNSSDM